MGVLQCLHHDYPKLRDTYLFSNNLPEPSNLSVKDKLLHSGTSRRHYYYYYKRKKNSILWIRCFKVVSVSQCNAVAATVLEGQYINCLCSLQTSFSLQCTTRLPKVLQQFKLQAMPQHSAHKPIAIYSQSHFTTPRLVASLAQTPLHSLNRQIWTKCLKSMAGGCTDVNLPFEGNSKKLQGTFR